MSPKEYYLSKRPSDREIRYLAQIEAEKQRALSMPVHVDLLSKMTMKKIKG